MPAWLRHGLVPGLLLLSAVALDVARFPGLEVPVALFYALPMLTAAQWLSTRYARLFVIVVLSLYAVLSFVRGIDPIVLAPRLAALASIGYLATLLAGRLEQAWQSRTEAEEALARAEVAQRRAEEAKVRAEAAGQNLQRFTRMVAHDLRGPLTIIRAYAQLLARTAPLSERSSAIVEGIQRETHRLNRLINDLWDSGCLDGGTFVLQRQPVDLVALACQVVEAFRADTASHEIELEAPAALPGLWDPDRLVQVLNNLLENAVKYSPPGSRVVVRVWQAGRQALVSVSDSGIGLCQQDIARLFQPFSRLQRGEGAGGAGLGLYISRGIIAAHGGEIWASSAGPGHGSTFTFSLPLAG